MFSDPRKAGGRKERGEQREMGTAVFTSWFKQYTHRRY